MPKSFTFAVAIVCFCSFLTHATLVRAQAVTTNVTFSVTVQLPGIELAPGNYRFALARDARSVLVSDAEHRIITTLPVIPTTRASRGNIVTMRPSVDGAPPQVSALYLSGGTSGVEFVYREAKK